MCRQRHENIMKAQYNWTATETLNLENSFGLIATKKNVKVKYSLWIIDDSHGGFEIDGGSDNWYAEGGLWFDGIDLVNYDGVFELSPAIIDKLKELGYNTEAI